MKQSSGLAARRSAASKAESSRGTPPGEQRSPGSCCAPTSAAKPATPSSLPSRMISQAGSSRAQLVMALRWMRALLPVKALGTLKIVNMGA